MKNLNLAQILKDKIGNTFFLTTINKECNLTHVSDKELIFAVDDELKLPVPAIRPYDNPKVYPCVNGVTLNWDDYINEQKLCGCWSDVVKYCKPFPKLSATVSIEINHSTDELIDCTCARTPFERAAVAMMKINTLIDKFYGGIFSQQEWDDEDLEKFAISPNGYIQNKVDFTIVCVWFDMFVPAFRSQELAEKFLSYPENVELLKDLYMYQNLNPDDDNPYNNMC